MEPWQPERVVDLELARRLVADQFPELAGARFDELRAGWDNTVYRVDGRYLFRFPRRQLAVGLLERELALLPALAPGLPLAIPLPCLVGRPSAAFPWPFAGYGWIDGATACALRLTAAAREAQAEPLAAFLSALHAFPVARATELGAAGDELDRMHVERRAARVVDDLRELRDEGLIATELGRELETLLESALALSAGAGEACLVHGDLYARHLILDSAGTLRGVIDWGDVHIGARSVDLALAHAFLPAPARRRFYARYGEVADELRVLARFRGMYHGLSTLKYAHRTGDGDLRFESEHALRQVLAD